MSITKINGKWINTDIPRPFITQESVVTDIDGLWAIIESLENIGDMRGEEQWDLGVQNATKILA